MPHSPVTLMCLAVTFFGWLSTPASGTTMFPPADRSVFSPDRRYELKISTEKGLHRLRTTKGFGKTLWKFTRNVWSDEYFVSTNGKYVAWVADRDGGGASDVPAIIVYSTQGEFSRTSYRQIGGSRPRRPDEPGPIYDNPRIWRQSVQRRGEKVTVLTPKGTKAVIDLSTGTITTFKRP